MVDTGFSHPERWRDGQGVEAQLEKHGLRREDVRYILHTHLHIDHAGYDSEFPHGRHHRGDQRPRAPVLRLRADGEQ